VLNVLGQIMDLAARRRAIGENPVRLLHSTERPVEDERETYILDEDEIGLLLDASLPHHRPVVMTAILAGLRQGEILGLQWKNVDFENGYVRVRATLTREKDARLQPYAKGRKHRDVILVPTLAQALWTHRLTSKFAGPEDFVFPGRNGEPLWWKNRRSAWRNSLKRAGITTTKPGFRFHDLRHTYPSILIVELKQDVKTVSTQMGHAKTSITVDRYTHLFDRGTAAHAELRAALEGFASRPRKVILGEPFRSTSRSTSSGVEREPTETSPERFPMNKPFPSETGRAGSV
jgi:integrase